MTELIAVSVVLILVAGAAYAVRRGAFGHRSGSGSIVVETAVTLGERRSLVIVTVEGRRLLLGLTPSTMSLVTELDDLPSPRAERGQSDTAGARWSHVIENATGQGGASRPDESLA